MFNSIFVLNVKCSTIKRIVYLVSPSKYCWYCCSIIVSDQLWLHGFICLSFLAVLKKRILPYVVCCMLSCCQMVANWRVHSIAQLSYHLDVAFCVCVHWYGEVLNGIDLNISLPCWQIGCVCANLSSRSKYYETVCAILLICSSWERVTSVCEDVKNLHLEPSICLNWRLTSCELATSFVVGRCSADRATSCERSCIYGIRPLARVHQLCGAISTWYCVGAVLLSVVPFSSAVNVVGLRSCVCAHFIHFWHCGFSSGSQPPMNIILLLFSTFLVHFAPTLHARMPIERPSPDAIL